METSIHTEVLESIALHAIKLIINDYMTKNQKFDTWKDAEHVFNVLEIDDFSEIDIYFVECFLAAVSFSENYYEEIFWKIEDLINIHDYVDIIRLKKRNSTLLNNEQ